ncbi:MAG TPA: Ppx/GppA family phosphatase, partial [Balneolaceae bacterium]|nr:Ppx/GppA family phosphatase [Balneolaceae bacterium]
ECEEILAYATSAIREAENGGEFIQRSIDEAGIKMLAIPGRVEAELIGLAVRHGVKLTSEPTLMADVGGGSVEFIIGNDKEFFYLASKKIGLSRMTEVFKPSDPITPEDIETLENHYEEQLRDVAQAFAQHRTDTIIGSSGTMENIAEMIAARKKKTSDVTLNEMEFSAEEFKEFYNDFIKLSRKERKKVSGLETKRVGFINTGVVLLDFLI